MTLVSAEGSAVDRVVDAIRKAIRSGALSPGQRLIEADLTAQFSIGRGSLREAFRRLSAEGLIDVAHNRGARVHRMSRDEVHWLYEIRESLEALAARLAAERFAEAGAEHGFAAVMAEGAQAIASGAYDRYADLNGRFHELLVETSGNPVLSRLIEQLHTPVFRLQTRRLMNRDTILISHAEHEAILAAMRAGDGEAAAAAMRAHIRNSSKLTADLADSFFGA